MKFIIACILSLAVIISVVGCGGGGSGSGASTPTVALTTVPTGAAPAGVTPVVTYASATQAIGESTIGGVFVAGALCSPASTQFTSPVTLTFHFISAISPSQSLTLFGSDTQNNWSPVVDSGSGSDVTATIAADGRSATVQVSAFSASGYFALLAPPNS